MPAGQDPENADGALQDANIDAPFATEIQSFLRENIFGCWLSPDSTTVGCSRTKNGGLGAQISSGVPVSEECGANRTAFTAILCPLPFSGFRRRKQNRPFRFSQGNGYTRSLATAKTSSVHPVAGNISTPPSNRWFVEAARDMPRAGKVR